MWALDAVGEHVDLPVAVPAEIIDLEFDRGDRNLDDRGMKIVVSIWHGSAGSDVLFPLLNCTY
jgi:hypothetical protein